VHGGPTKKPEPGLPRRLFERATKDVLVTPAFRQLQPDESPPSGSVIRSRRHLQPEAVKHGPATKPVGLTERGEMRIKIESPEQPCRDPLGERGAVQVRRLLQNSEFSDEWRGP